MKHLLLLLITLFATFAMEDVSKNSKFSLEQETEELIEKIRSMYIPEPGKDMKKQNEESQDMKNLLFQSEPIGSLNKNAESQNLSQDTQIEPNLSIPSASFQMKKLKNAQYFSIDKRGAVKFDPFRSKNEHVKIEDISLNLKKKSEALEEPPTCTICFGSIEENEEKLTTDCNHLYHFGCLQQWQKDHTSCPLCKRDIKMSQVWITRDDFVRTKYRSHLHQNLEIGQNADLENQQNQLLPVPVIMQRGQIVDRPHQRQNQNVQIADRANQRQNQNESEVSLGNKPYIYCTTGFTWFIIQILIIFGAVFSSKWGATWFPWMQAFHGFTFLLLVASKYCSGCDDCLGWALNFLLLFGALTYHSIGTFELQGSAVVHYNFWPWFAALFVAWPSGLTIDGEYNWIPGWRTQVVVYFLWSLVQISIILGRLYVLQWAVWYEFMQGFHVYALFLYFFGWLKHQKSIARNRGPVFKLQFFVATVFNVLVGIASYHSITGIILSGGHLVIASISPWLAGALLLLIKCCVKIGVCMC